VAALSGTGRLADDLYLMAHHEVSGKPHLQPRAAGLGLAGALLAELILAGSIRLSPGGVVVAGRTPPEDVLARSVLGLVLSEHEEYAARDWLLFLARTAPADVARRLGEAGYLARASSRRPWRGQRWVPVSPDCAFAPINRVLSVLDPARPVTVTAAALAGLAAACGLGPRVLMYAPPRARRGLEDAAGQLPAGLRDLIAQTRAAVDSAVLSHRA
jgi:Golgi phosphoprotein 3 (GPP34)